MGTFSAFEKENWKTQAANEPSWPCPHPQVPDRGPPLCSPVASSLALSEAVVDMGLGHTSEDMAQPGAQMPPTSQAFFLRFQVALLSVWHHYLGGHPSH